MPYECASNLGCIDENQLASVTTNCNDKTRSRQILISYVRAEAAEHALRLKHSLSRCGFDVFLVSCVIFTVLVYTVNINTADMLCVSCAVMAKQIEI